MRGYSTMTDEERASILKQHSKTYDGYAVGNVQSNMTPLTVYDAAQDKEGVTVTANGEVKSYRNHNINEITAKNLHYDEIDPAYDFDSKGPNSRNLGYNVYNSTIPAYEFDSKGPSDPFYGGGYHDENSTTYQPEADEVNFEPLLDMDDYLDKNQYELDDIVSEINKSLDMFKKFKKYN
jgi:hypothetical protein